MILKHIVERPVTCAAAHAVVYAVAVEGCRGIGKRNFQHRFCPSRNKTTVENEPKTAKSLPVLSGRL